MNVATANLVGITGIARRLVQDGSLDEAVARTAMAQAGDAKVPLAQWLNKKKQGRNGAAAPRRKRAVAAQAGFALCAGFAGAG